MEARGPPSEANFSGVLPQAEFQLKDLPWRKVKLPYFLSYLQLRKRSLCINKHELLCRVEHLAFTNVGGGCGLGGWGWGIASNMEERLL